MDNIAGRLKAERERLGLTQEGLALAMGCGKRALANYESGERSPDAAQLSGAANVGVDVLFVITGQRSQAVPPTAGLSARQRAVLDNYEHTDEEGKRHIEQAALLAAKSAASAKRGKAA